MLKDTQFYNKESAIYSEKRYPKNATNYIQFFFKERLRLTIAELKKSIKDRQDLSLLEIGCADGIVAYEIQQACPHAFSHIVGIDISPGMIDAAREKFGTTGIIFQTRDKYTDTQKHDVIIEIGVINYATLDGELKYIAERLTADGVAIISLAGTGSVWDKTRKSDTGFNTFQSYAEYETAISKKFTIIKTEVVGIPIPFIWRSPGFARMISSGLENTLRYIAPNLFHEKIYVIKLKNI